MKCFDQRIYKMKMMNLNQTNIFYVYDDQNKIKEIRTRLTTPNVYVIQKPIQNIKKIQYRFEVISDNAM
jgi:hypothetical protein